MAKTNAQTQVADAAPVVVTQPAGSEALITALLDPTARAAALANFEKGLSEAEGQAAKFRQAIASLGGETAPVAPVRRSVGRPRKAGSVRKAGSTGKAGRPPGKGADHGGAIRTALKGSRSGMTLSELHEAMVGAKHKVERKTVATYLRNMINRKEISKLGDRGSFKYKLIAQ